MGHTHPLIELAAMVGLSHSKNAFLLLSIFLLLGTSSSVEGKKSSSSSHEVQLLESQLQRLSSSVSTWRQETSSYEGTVTSHTQTLASLKEQAIKFSQELTHFESSISKLQDCCSGYSKKISILQLTVHTLQASVEENLNALSELECDISSIKRTSKSSQVRMTFIEHQLSLNLVQLVSNINRKGRERERER